LLKIKSVVIAFECLFVASFANIRLFSQTIGLPTALVIGNKEYPSFPLSTTVQDAVDFGAALKVLGWDVETKIDLTLKEMKDLIGKFADKSEDSSEILFYYAGHAVQLNGENYLVPVDATFESAEEIPQITISLRDIFDSLKGEGAKIVILDACRNNPFRSGRGRILPIEGEWIPGLAPPSGATDNTLIAYATDPGKEAADPTLSFEHSYYTWALLQNMQEPGLEVRDLFSRVREIVRTSTQRHQTPWENVSLLNKKIYFRKPATVRISVPDRDDFVVCFLNGEEIFSAQLDDPIPSGEVPLKSGENKFVIKVYNQKTYRNQNPFLGREGWKYKVILSQDDSPEPLKIFEGREDNPPESRWGRFFTVATAVIYVDPKTGKISIF